MVLRWVIRWQSSEAFCFELLREGLGGDNVIENMYCSIWELFRKPVCIFVDADSKCIPETACIPVIDDEYLSGRYRQ